VKILHLYDGHEQVYDGKGSVPNVVWNVARETAARGHEVTVLERQWNSLLPVAEHEGVAFRRLDLRTGADEPWERVPYEQIGSLMRLARLVGDRTNFALATLPHFRDLSFDVLHVHLPFAANVLLTLAPWLRSRMVYTGHLGEIRLDALEENQRAGNGGLNVPSILKYISPDIKLAQRAAHATVLNDDIYEVLVERGIPDERLTVIPNGVDIERFSNVSENAVAKIEEKYEFSEGPVVLFVGAIMPRKGVDDLVRAVAEVVDEGYGDLRVVLAGEDELDGVYVSEVKSLVCEEGLEDVVSIPGFVPGDELPALYTAADVFAMPSREEGFGMTVTEAMATGTPVVGTRVGAIPQLVEDGQEGALVAPNDPEALATELHRLLSSSELSAMSARAVKRAEAYSWQSIADQFERVYHEVAA
jgi:glycosyltransferase involved in cell wall biosynthesis